MIRSHFQQDNRLQLCKETTRHVPVSGSPVEPFGQNHVTGPEDAAVAYLPLKRQLKGLLPVQKEVSYLGPPVA